MWLLGGREADGAVEVWVVRDDEYGGGGGHPGCDDVDEDCRRWWWWCYYCGCGDGASRHYRCCLSRADDDMSDMEFPGTSADCGIGSLP